jgi:hypothetical protein
MLHYLDKKDIFVAINVRLMNNRVEVLIKQIT